MGRNGAILWCCLQPLSNKIGVCRDDHRIRVDHGCRLGDVVRQYGAESREVLLREHQTKVRIGASVREIKTPIKALGHLVNAVRGLEWVVGQTVQDNPALLDRMTKVSAEIEEAQRLILEEAQWPTGITR